MAEGNDEFAALGRAGRRRLRALLIGLVAGQPGVDGDAGPLVAAAPIRVLPAAAALHRLSGTVRRAVQGADGIPDAVIAELTAAEHHSTVRHLTYVGALSAIARAFDAEGVEWVAMKGPVVAALLYPGVGDRSYADVDLLVRRRHFGAAMRILEDLGYRHAIRDWARAEEMLAGQVGLSTPSVALDLHWHLHYSSDDRRPFALDPEGMIGRSRRVEVSGLDVPTLDPVDTVLTLGFHAARSGGHRLVWLKDIERAIAADGADLDELVVRCRAARCGPPVGLMLARTRAVLGAPVPERIVSALTPRSVLAIDRASSAIVGPIQLHERETITRALTRSVRSSLAGSIADVPARAGRAVLALARSPRSNETDDPLEKASYVRAVASSDD